MEEDIPSGLRIAAALVDGFLVAAAPLVWVGILGLLGLTSREPIVPIGSAMLWIGVWATALVPAVTAVRHGMSMQFTIDAAATIGLIGSVALGRDTADLTGFVALALLFGWLVAAVQIAFGIDGWLEDGDSLTVSVVKDVLHAALRGGGGPSVLAWLLGGGSRGMRVISEELVGSLDSGLRLLAKLAFGLVAATALLSFAVVLFALLAVPSALFAPLRLIFATGGVVRSWRQASS
jgi:hypothetical protein